MAATYTLPGVIALKQGDGRSGRYRAGECAPLGMPRAIEYRFSSMILLGSVCSTGKIEIRYYKHVNPPAPPTNRGVKFPAEILGPEEVRALLYAPSSRAPTGMRNRALIAVMYGAGLRLSEALALKPSDVNLDAGEIRVLHGKGDQARTAGIDQGAVVHLARWVDKRKALGIRGRVLLCRLDGGAVDPRYVRAMLRRVADKAGIDKRVHPHGLRHTHAAELERDGFTVTEIQQQLGHSSLNTTAIYLNHISPSARVAKVSNRRSTL